MYDFITGKYRGLDQREEGLVAFGMNPEDLKEANKDIADRDERFKEMSLEVGRDLRFPTEKELKRREESRKRFTKMVRGNLNE